MAESNHKWLRDHFRVRKICPDRPHLWVNVQVYECSALLSKWYGHDVLGYFSHTLDDVTKLHGRIGTIALCRHRKLNFYAMHEAIHAAFSLSRYRMKWDYTYEHDREEYIVRAAEYIYEQIHRRFQKKGWYK